MPQDNYNDISLLLDRLADRLDNIPFSALDQADAPALQSALDLLRQADAAIAPVAERYRDHDPE